MNDRISQKKIVKFSDIGNSRVAIATPEYIDKSYGLSIYVFINRVITTKRCLKKQFKGGRFYFGSWLRGMYDDK